MFYGTRRPVGSLMSAVHMLRILSAQVGGLFGFGEGRMSRLLS
jgi:hypothetical protein